MRSSFVSLALALSLSSSATEAQSTSLIRNVRVFDGERIVERRDVLVSNGVIGQVAAPGLPVPRGATVVDGTGRTLLPGFIDSHVHLSDSAAADLRQALSLGVTTVLDMWTGGPRFDAIKALRSADAPNVAAVLTAGIGATAPGGHPSQMGGPPFPTIADSAEADAFVSARIAEGSDYIKIVYDDGHTYGIKFATIDKPTMKAVVDAAHARKKLAVVHIGDLAGARDAIDVGANGLVHLFVDSMPDAAFARLVSAHKAFVVPTLSVLESVSWGDGGKLIAKDPKLAPYIPAANVQSLEQTFPKRAGSPPRDLAFALETVRQLRAAGVPILAGTDAPNPGTAHGASMHRELELLVKAGLTPTEALRAATSVPAHTFSLPDRGRIATGLRGDLVLVNGDPTADILATRDIAGVWKRGVAIHRDAYRDELAKAAALATSGTFAVPAGSESGDVSDFDGGQPTVKFGSGWFVTTDQLAGGKSTAAIKVVSGGANSTAGALEITGTLDAGLPYGWSGVMFTAGQTPMAPVNLSAKKELRFFSKAEEGRSYAIMVFTRSKGQMPVIQRFTASADWKEIVMPFSAFAGTDAHDLMGIAFVASGTPGPFKLLIDDVKVR